MLGSERKGGEEHEKRFVGLLAVVLVLFGFTACGGAASGAAADKMEIAETMAVSPPAAAGGHMPEAPAFGRNRTGNGRNVNIPVSDTKADPHGRTSDGDRRI